MLIIMWVCVSVMFGILANDKDIRKNPLCWLLAIIGLWLAVEGLVK